MAYRYRTSGTAALKPEELANAHQTPIIDFDSLTCSTSAPASHTPFQRQRMAQRLHADPLIGSIGHAFGARANSSTMQRKTFAVAFSVTFLLFLGAILFGA